MRINDRHSVGSGRPALPEFLTIWKFLCVISCLVLILWIYNARDHTPSTVTTPSTLQSSSGNAITDKAGELRTSGYYATFTRRQSPQISLENSQSSTPKLLQTSLEASPESRSNSEDSQSSTAELPQSVTFQYESIKVVRVADASMIPSDVWANAITLGGPRRNAGVADSTGSGSRPPYIIYGDVDISCGPITHQDIGHAYITLAEGTITEVEMGLESNPPRGPPEIDSGNPDSSRPIYIVGEIRSYSGPDQLHESFMYTKVIDLSRIEPKENREEPFGRSEYGSHRRPGFEQRDLERRDLERRDLKRRDLERRKPTERPRYEARPRMAP